MFLCLDRLRCHSFFLFFLCFIVFFTDTINVCAADDFSTEHVVVCGNGKVLNPETKYNMELNFLPYSVTPLDAPVGNYDMLALYKVRIPLYVNMGDFDGRLWGSSQFFWDAINYTLTSKPSGATVLYRASSRWVESESPDVTFTTNGSNSVQAIYYTDNYVSPQFYLCWDVSVYLSSGTYTSNALANQLLVYFYNFSYTSRFKKISDSSSAGVLDEINQGIKDTNDTIKDQHQQEIDSANSASGEISSSVGQVTDVLSKWEIATLPVTMGKDLIDAITSEGDDGLTFPSFSIHGQEIWPSYTFHLSVIEEKFPLLVDSLHVISGILVLFFFVRFIRGEWEYLVYGVHDGWVIRDD